VEVLVFIRTILVTGAAMTDKCWSPLFSRSAITPW
jgi:hypothetical protein